MPSWSNALAPIEPTFSGISQEDEEENDDDEDIDEGQVLQLVLVLAGGSGARLCRVRRSPE